MAHAQKPTSAKKSFLWRIFAWKDVEEPFFEHLENGDSTRAPVSSCLQVEAVTPPSSKRKAPSSLIPITFAVPVCVRTPLSLRGRGKTSVSGASARVAWGASQSRVRVTEELGPGEIKAVGRKPGCCSEATASDEWNLD